jgi:CubicO group peptidase (beta-lactamase class C family)
MKKFFKRLFLGILLLLVVFSGYALISGKTFLFTAIWYNFANIDDYKKFSNREVAIGTAQPWTNAPDYNQHPYADSTAKLLEDLKSVGLLVVRNGQVLEERYWAGYSDSSKSGSFSVAKSITSILIGVALKEGKISSLQDPVGKYLPEFSTGDKAAVRIIDLLTMSSGTDWSESYINLFSVTSEAYYGHDIYAAATGVHMKDKPGTLHSYKSGDTQLLGLILEKATGKTLSDYASEKLWQPLGAEHPALWSTDKEEGGHEKAYCCFNSNVRDFARIGQLMLDSGKWKGATIIDSSYWANAIKPCGIKDLKGNTCDYYGFQWWIDPVHPEVFYARGILGQYIIVIPSKKMVIVRLGEKTAKERVRTVPKEVRALIDWGYAIPSTI